MRKKHILHKEFHLEEWLHKKLTFKNDSEFAIFLAWAMAVAFIFYNA